MTNFKVGDIVRNKGNGLLFEITSLTTRLDNGLFEAKCLNYDENAPYYNRPYNIPSEKIGFAQHPESLVIDNSHLIKELLGVKS